MRDLKMKLNIAKTKMVHFGKLNLVTNYQIQDECINYKILETTESGIIVSSNFNQKEQVEKEQEQLPFVPFNGTFFTG